MQHQQHYSNNASDPFNSGGSGFGQQNGGGGFGGSGGGGFVQRQPTPPQTFQVNTNMGNVGGDQFGGAGFYAGGGVSSGSRDDNHAFFGSVDTMSGGAAVRMGSSSHNDLSGGSSMMGGTSSPAEAHRTRFGCPEDDLPLLQELGVFPRHIQAKALAVLNPLATIPVDAIEDMDLAGPVMFAVALGFLLSLQGKVQFGAIYGLSLLGICFAKMLLTLMCEQHSVALQFVVSTLGYCLLPNLVLALVQTFQYWLVGSHVVILPVAFLVMCWSAWCATTMFVHALAMESQRFLVLYPCFLFYAVFAALTIF